MSLKKLISGGQAGADRSALDCAIQLGFPHGGFCPKGRRAEDGIIPERYNLTETKSADYRIRNYLNVKNSDGTVIFTPDAFITPGSQLTINYCKNLNKPFSRFCLNIFTNDHFAAINLYEWIEKNNIEILNVAGTRESKAPGIQERVKQIILEALEHLPRQ